MGLLQDLKDWIYQQRLKHRQEKQRAEKAQAVAEAKARAPKQLELDDSIFVSEVAIIPCKLLSDQQLYIVAIDIVGVGSLLFVKKKGGPDASILYEVPCQAGNEEH
jgi:hypothetical protein